MYMMNKLPPLNALRAFETVSRYLSVTKAAEELHVTHAAVSQQIKLLENTLNISLIRREGKRIGLTSDGEAYAAILRAAFTSIKQATFQLQKEYDPHVLTVRIPPTLALRWFIPRMSAFQNKYPNIDLRISTAANEVDFSQSNIDIAIIYDKGNWENLHHELLFDDYLYPVCNPSLINPKSGKLRDKLSAYKFIYVSAELRQKDWANWFKKAELEEPPKPKHQYFQNTIQALQAAEAGLGIAITHEPFVKDAIKSGKLITPFDLKLKLPSSYYLVCPEQNLRYPKVKHFRNWLLSERSKSVSSIHTW
jgi:LysR family glycine cleavage system transcriptional activator